MFNCPPTKKGEVEECGKSVGEPSEPEISALLCWDSGFCGPLACAEPEDQKVATSAAIKTRLNHSPSSAGQKFAASNLADEALISFEEVEAEKIAAIHPEDLLENPVLHLACILFHAIEM